MTLMVKGRPGLALAGARTMKKFAVAAALTLSAAVPVLPEGVCVPVTVCGPATVALQLPAVQLPSGAMVKLVAAVTSPRSLPKASWACAVYVCDPPDVMGALAGASTRWSMAAPETRTLAEPLMELVCVSVALIVCVPAVLRLTLKMCTPASAVVKGELAGG